MKKPEWLFVGILLIVGAYFGYRHFSKTKAFNPLQLVPKSSVAVYETSDLPGVFSAFKRTKYWQDILDLSSRDIISQMAIVIDSILVKGGQFSSKLSSNLSIISLHITGNESASLMIYLPTGVGSRKFLESTLEKLTTVKPVYSTRVYDGLTIHELIANDKLLTYLNHKDYVIISPVGYLIEDVVRNLNQGMVDNFFSINSELVKVPKLNDDAGNIYINGQQLSAYYQTLLPALHSEVGILAKSIFFDLNLTNQEMLLSGFLFENSRDEFAAIFENQEASFPASIKLVPDNAAMVVSINVSDITSWYEAWINRFPIITEDLQAGAVISQAFINNILGDITLTTFSSNDKTINDKLLFIKLSDKEGMLNLLNKQAELIAENEGDSVYYEMYTDRRIGLIDRIDFPASILGSPFSGFSSTYYMLYENYIVFAPSVDRIKRWLGDIEDDNIWGRSVRVSSFIDENLAETTFALVLNNPWSWSLFYDQFNQKHQRWWQKNETAIKQFGLASFQFTNLDNKYYSAVNILYQPIAIETGFQELEEHSLTQFSHKISKKPKLVKNHNDGSWEILIMDSTNQLSLLGSDGEILWSDSLPGQIDTEIFQVDYFKNNKLQYLFAIDSVIFLIDRNGEAVADFPRHLNNLSVAQLHLVDYDHSKNYRFLTADDSGNIHMFNQEFTSLEGWNPLALNSALTDQLFHVRARGKDRIIIAKENGIVELRNRRGELQPGFPLDLQFNIDGPIHFKVGSTFKSSIFTAVAKEGLVIQFDLNGTTHLKNQIDMEGSSSAFNLIIDPVQNDYIIARQDLNRLTVLAKDGEQIFEKDYQVNSLKEVQYYSLGIDKQLFIVRDTESGKVYLYNKNGGLVNSNTLYSDYPVSIVYRKSQAKCYIYTAVGQLLEVNNFIF